MRSTIQPKDVGADPFAAPAPPAKPKAAGIADPFGGPAPPAKPKAKDHFADDPFGEREPAKSDKPKNPFKDPADPFE